MKLMLIAIGAASLLAVAGCTSNSSGSGSPAITSPSLPSITAVTDTATTPTVTPPDTDLPTATDPANDCDVLCDSTLPSPPPGVDCSVIDCSSTLPRDDTVAAPPPKPTITFKVTGNGTRSTSITIGVGTHISQANGARLPWKKTIDDTASFYQVFAQASNGTRISCEIDSSDGTVLDKNTSTGQYAVVSCSGSV